MTPSKIMRQAHAILDEARAAAWSKEALRGRLEGQFPNTDIDAEAHREIRQWALGMYETWLAGNQDSRGGNPLKKIEPAAPGRRGKSGTLGALQVGMTIRYQELHTVRTLKVSAIRRNGDWLNVALMRPCGRKYAFIEGTPEQPFQSVPRLVSVPALEWERHYEEEGIVA